MDLISKKHYKVRNKYMKEEIKKRIEEMVEYVANVCDKVEFLHGVPVDLPSETKALLRGRIREALIKIIKINNEYEKDNLWICRNRKINHREKFE